ncbi:MAG TPA: translocation/assembly module TamB domain-containing protein, partial [Rhizomicrobium sp.]|nr:translocation/assembly module TamB domain-containing protein [Rhizomicrobium sp.]
IHLSAQAAGDANANTIAFRLSAGALTASGQGTLALATQSADIDFSANAPAMRPSADIAWQSLAFEAHMRGRADAPVVSATLNMSGVEAVGLSAAQLAADVTGDSGALDLKGTASGLRIPGDQADVFAAAPVTIAAHADLRQATLPVLFSIAHPLVNIRGKADLQGETRVAAIVTVPSLAPLAALGNVAASGSAQFNVQVVQNGTRTALALGGKMNVEGRSLVAGLLGPNATLLMNATIAGTDITQSRVQLDGAGIHSQTVGDFRDKRLNYGIKLSLPDLSRLDGNLTGNLSLAGTANGPLDTATLHLSGKADMASRGFRRQNIDIDIQAKELTKLYSADVRASGSFDDAPVFVAGTLTGRNAKLNAQWRSLDAKADVMLPQSGSQVTGNALVEIGNLTDIALLTGTKLAGRLKAAIDLKPRGSKAAASVHADMSGVAFGGTRIGAATIDGTVDDPFGKPSVALAAAAQGLDAGGMSGNAHARLNGPLDKLAIALTSDLQDPGGNPTKLAADAVVDIPRSRATLQRLSASWRGQDLALKAPAIVDFASGLSVENFDASVAGGELVLSGDISPKLTLTLSARSIPASALQTFVPQLQADGTFSANAKLKGTLDAPLGTITLQGRDLRARGYSGKAIPLAQLDAEAVLRGTEAKLDVTLAAGKSVHLSLTGEAPLNAHAKADLSLNGTGDLAMLNPVLLSDGRQARGTLAVDMRIAGSQAKPHVTGKATVSDGEVQDFARGARLRNISADIEAQGDVLRLSAFTAHAGPGTITASGSIDLAAPGMPIDIAIQAKSARPIVSEMMTATLSGDVKLSGQLEKAMTLSGRVFVTKGEINLPDQFPPEVAVLDVRRRGQKPPPPPEKPTTIALDLTVASSTQIFVRGHGIEANLGGRIQLSGTTGAPLVGGGFTMERGTFSLAGQTLNFTSGKVSFDGTGVRNTLDPTLNFVAQTSSGGVTATLTVTGYASQPKIVLTSSPQLPQDEILAHLLFQQSTKQLTPLQLAQIAQAIASLGGVGNGFNPLGALRKTLGLDRLAVGSTTGGASGSEQQTTVEAGKYVARNVYVGARQNLSGGTQVLIQVDLTRKLKAQATLSTETNATATKGSAAQDNGSSVGLSYEFEY